MSRCREGECDFDCGAGECFFCPPDDFDAMEGIEDPDHPCNPKGTTMQVTRDTRWNDVKLTPEAEALVKAAAKSVIRERRRSDALALAALLAAILLLAIATLARQDAARRHAKALDRAVATMTAAAQSPPRMDVSRFIEEERARLGVPDGVSVDEWRESQRTRTGAQ